MPTYLSGVIGVTGLKAVLFMMTSGQMWNHIRAPPFMDSDPRSGSVVSDILSCSDFHLLDVDVDNSQLY